MAQTLSFAGSELGEVGVLLYRTTSLSMWDNPPSHDQIGYNISMMVSLDLYSRDHNTLALHNCNRSDVRDLFLVPFHLDLVHAPKIQCAPSLNFDRGPVFQSELYR